MAGHKKTKLKIPRGQDLEKLAKNHGYKSFAEIHSLPENRKLRKDRPKPSEVTTGDVVFFYPNGPKPQKVKYVKDTGRMKLEIDGEARKIKISQTWSYSFIKGEEKKGLHPWTDKEKKLFMKLAEKQIIRRWHKKCKMEVLGKSQFARYFKGEEFKVEVSISVVSSGGHWKCIVRKIGKKDTFGSFVDWGPQTIHLDINDGRPEVDEIAKKISAKKEERLDKANERRRTGKRMVGQKEKPKNKYKQDVVAHEFGHTLGLIADATEDWPEGITRDEYNNGPFIDDRKALMNKGTEMRKRYFAYVVYELGKIIPQTDFSVTKVG